MYKKLHIYFLSLLLLSFFSANAQNIKTGIIRGKLINRSTKQPVDEARLTLLDMNMLVTSDGEGKFMFSKVPLGSHKMAISGNGIHNDTINVNNDKPLLFLGNIEVSNGVENVIATQAIPTLSIEDVNTTTQEDGVVANIANVSTTSNDPLPQTSIALFTYNFNRRGYVRAEQDNYINGVPVNNIETGNPTWSQTAGLNDVMHSRNFTQGLNLSPYSFGGLRGSIYTNATAADQRKETKVTYTFNNRSFGNQIMATHNSGLMKNGWAYSLSASRRWEDEGYKPGTFYDGGSIYAAVSKVINTANQINFTAFGTMTKRGGSSAETREMYDLAGTNNYNSSWGYQNGVKRNAKVSEVYHPIFILDYEYKPQTNLVWKTSLAYQFGKNSRSNIDYYNGQSPLPDYYRNLPSYYLNSIPPDSVTAATVKAEFKANPSLLQINWNRLYNSNYTNVTTVYNVNGVLGNNYTGKESIYILSNTVEDLKKLIFNTNVEYSLGKHATLYSGLALITQRTENYRQVADLLGGDFWVNYNQFAARQYVGNTSYNQNNLNAPNQLVRTGDKYGEDYYFHYNKGWWWGQAAFNYNKVDFFLAATGAVNSFTREGLMRNGLFANNSYGTSATQSFFTYGVKGGAIYKIDGHQYLFANVSYSREAPTIPNTYISPGTRDFTVSNPTSEKNASIEGGYQLRKPNYSVRVEGFATNITDATEIKRFYNDDPQYLTFINYVIQNISIQHIGTEISAEVKITKSLSVTGVASISQTFYANNPNVSVYLDNDTTRTSTSRKVYIKNYYLGVGPQSVYSVNLNYRPRGYWNANLRFNYLDRNYIGINPDRRTPQAADLVTP
ncbi:MAG: hypothetical protein WCG87_12475, partial [Bacteroidota bacterium]